MPKVNIIYEDDKILVVNKPHGLECATRDKSSENTYSLEEIFADKNAIVIHRLDRLTEGIVILAKNKQVAKDFESFFRERKVSKFYKAYVYGKPKDEGIKTAYLKKDDKLSKVTISNIPLDGYKEIVTEFKIEKSTDKYSLLDINLHTGRTHQIRGYFSHIDCPIIGDKKYSKNTSDLEKEYTGYYLTAYKISFNLDREYTYLNDKTFEISPSWLKYI
jgi:23S rRNA pseudouridine955/2504/2580 synthase